jgi:acetoin utilization deacetylase AcuC-like enzyme
MTTLIFHHPACSRHDTGSGHPESAARLAAIEKALSEPPLALLPRREAPPATREQILRVHTGRYLRELLESVPANGLRHLDPDTVVSPASGEAALRAAGAVCAAVDAVMAGNAKNAFCAIRPPGHHAKPDGAMGFCLLNNIAIAARHALVQHNLQRVAIVDFDVHHGNGSQAAFEAEPRVLYASTHQHPWYPGTGRASETGVGNIVNLPLKAGSGSAEFRQAYEARIFPALEKFQPQMLLISAGFDAHRDDPLGDLELEEADFQWVTAQLGDLADRHCQGRMASTLEGGYDLDALARSVAAHVTALSLQ